jgi:hypothetical protein
MIRKMYGALALLTVAVFTFIGCGTEDVSDLSNDWTKMDGDVRQKLDQVKTAHQELMGKFTAVPVANTTDTNVAAERTVVDQTLKDQETKIGDVETMLANNQTKHDEATKSGKRADFEAAWNAAKPDYEAALAKLDEISQQTSDLSSKVDGWSKPATTDTTAAPAKADSVTAATGAK